MRTRAALLASLAVCLLVGPPVSAQGAEGEFLALTYNVAGLPQGISSSDPQTNSPLIGPKLNAYDLVLLQEDWGDPLGVVPLFFHEEVVAGADHPHRSEPAPHPYGTDLRRFPTGPPLIADGLNRLSRFPFGPIERVMWEECFGEFAVEAAEVILGAGGLDDAVPISGGAADCGAQKGFSVARTELAPGVAVDVYNLHGEAGGGPEDRAASAAGFAQLARYIVERSAGNAIILGGDTNLHTSGEDVRAEDAAVWEAFQEATGVMDVCVVVECGADAGEIDKFAFRPGNGVELVPLSHRFERERFTRPDGEPLSDHDALAVRFAWGVAEGGGATDAQLPMTGRTVVPVGIALCVSALLVRRTVVHRTARSREMVPGV